MRVSMNQILGLGVWTVISSCGNAFTPQSRLRLRTSLQSTKEQQFELTYIPNREEVYEQLGIQPGQLALTIDPQEVLEHIGTREFMVSKALEDISDFDQKKAEDEVDKMLLDPEVMKAYIEFNKWRADNPDVELPGEEPNGLFTFQNFLVVYFIFIAGQYAYRFYEANFAPAAEVMDSDIAGAVPSDAAAAALDAAASVAGADAVTSGSVDAVVDAVSTVTSTAGDVAAVVVDAANSLFFM